MSLMDNMIASMLPGVDLQAIQGQVIQFAQLFNKMAQTVEQTANVARENAENLRIIRLHLGLAQGESDKIEQLTTEKVNDA